MFARIALIIHLFSVPALWAAEGSIFSCSTQKKLSTQDAQSTLSKAQAEYGKLSGFKAKFLQDSYLSSLEISELSSGQVWFKKPGKMRWSYDRPEEQLFIFNEHDVWFYQATDRQAIIDRIDKVVLSDLPVAFLMGIGDLGRDFKIGGACKTGEGIVLELSPKQPKNADGPGVKDFKLLVSSTAQILGAEVSDLGGNVTSIILEAIEPNLALEDSLFAANLPKGTDVDDRRGEIK